MKNQKSQNFLYREKKEKLQNFGLNLKPSRFFLRVEAGGFVAFDSLNSKVYFINNSAKEILSLINKGFSREEIIQKLSKKYNFNVNELRKDITNFLDEVK